jgi:hypothetical protein
VQRENIIPLKVNNEHEKKHLSIFILLSKIACAVQHPLSSLHFFSLPFSLSSPLSTLPLCPYTAIHDFYLQNHEGKGKRGVPLLREGREGEKGGICYKSNYSSILLIKFLGDGETLDSNIHEVLLQDLIAS